MTDQLLLVSFDTLGRGWASAWRGRERAAEQLIETALDATKARRSGEMTVEIVFATDAKLRALNKTFRGKDKPTNVLSFPNLQQPYGSIILAFETIRAEANAQDKSFIRHAKHMILHGFLHLLGYDHETATDRRLMERLEIRILAGMGIPNPYLLAR